MTYEIAQRARRRTRRALLMAAVSFVTLVTLVTLAVVQLRGGADSPLVQADRTGGSAGGQATPNATGKFGESPGSATPGALAGEQQPDVTFSPDVAEIYLPVSKTAGPFQGRHVLRFEHSERGAAFAAVHLLVRSDFRLGSKYWFPVLSYQLVDTPDASRLLTQTAMQYEMRRKELGLESGEPLITRIDTDFIGYRMQYSGDSAVVNLLGRRYNAANPSRPSYDNYALTVRWQEDTWKLVPPPEAQWSRVRTTVASNASYVPFASSTKVG